MSGAGNVPTLPSLCLLLMFSSLFRVRLHEHTLTNFKSRLLGWAVFVHLAHKRAHLHRVLVLMVQAVGLKETEQPHMSKMTTTLHNRAGAADCISERSEICKVRVPVV